MVPLDTPADAFKVWTKRIGNNPELRGQTADPRLAVVSHVGQNCASGELRVGGELERTR